MGSQGNSHVGRGVGVLCHSGVAYSTTTCHFGVTVGVGVDWAAGKVCWGKTRVADESELAQQRETLGFTCVHALWVQVPPEAAHFSLEKYLPWMCCVAMPCLFELACFFLSFLPSSFNTYIYIYNIHVYKHVCIHLGMGQCLVINQLQNHSADGFTACIPQ